MEGSWKAALSAAENGACICLEEFSIDPMIVTAFGRGEVQPLQAIVIAHLMQGNSVIVVTLT